jgi:histidinol phosphatase-like enzyme (inositol monophosphatase family)
VLEFHDPVRVGSQELQAYLEFAKTAAREAGAETLGFFRTALEVDDKRQKGAFDPVTAADRAAEMRFREAVGARFPEHGVLGEEFGHAPGNGLTWVIDPIDGTRAFMTGLVHWGVLIALFDGQNPVLGVMFQPFTGEIFYGDGSASWWERGSERRRLTTRVGVDLPQSLLATTSPAFFRSAFERQALERLQRLVKMSTYGGDCYLYAMVAMGGLDLAIDAGLGAYDIQALIPIIRGAGGVISTVDGGNPSLGGFVVAAGSVDLHRAACRVLRDESAPS